MAYIKKIKLPRVDTPYEILDANAVPNTRKVNGKQLNEDISLTAADVGALSDTVTSLKNPNAITFTGGATGTYDGSSAVTIAIPEGGGGTEVVVSATQPTQTVGSLWFKVV